MVAGAPHPGPAAVVLPEPIRAAIIAHARAQAPNEACGIVIGTAPVAAGGAPVRFLPTRNVLESPLRYEIHPQDLLKAFLEAERDNQEFWAIVHSHVASAPVPSPTDLGLALWPEALYVLVSLAPDEVHPISGEPGVRAWRIVGGTLSGGRIEGATSFEVEVTVES